MIDELDYLEYQKIRRELLEKFGPEWVAKMNYDATARFVFEALVRGRTAYDVIEQLIIIIAETKAALLKHIIND